MLHLKCRNRFGLRADSDQASATFRQVGQAANINSAREQNVQQPCNRLAILDYNRDIRLCT
jgi:hypothetical protein